MIYAGFRRYDSFSFVIFFFNIAYSNSISFFEKRNDKSTNSRFTDIMKIIKNAEFRLHALFLALFASFRSSCFTLFFTSLLHFVLRFVASNCYHVCNSASVNMAHCVTFFIHSNNKIILIYNEYNR